MNRFSKVSILMISALFLTVGHSMALPYGKGLEKVFNDIALDGQNDVNVYTDMIGDAFDSAWNIGATGTSAATFVIEITDYASTNTFGIYNNNNYIQLFSGKDSTSSKAEISIGSDGSICVTNRNEKNQFIGYKNYDPGTFQGTTFGYYIDVKQHGKFFSDTALNTDKLDHMLAYQGVGEWVDVDGSGIVPKGKWEANEYILAFEDVPGTGADRDFTDFVVMVESVQPVPEPDTLILTGLGLFGLAGLGRKRYKK